MNRKYNAQGTHQKKRSMAEAKPNKPTVTEEAPREVSPSPIQQEQKSRTLERKKTAFDSNNTVTEKEIHDQYYSELSEKFQELELRRMRQLEKFDLTNKEDILNEIEQFKKRLDVKSLDAELLAIEKKNQDKLRESEINHQNLSTPQPVKQGPVMFPSKQLRSTSNNYFKTPTKPIGRMSAGPTKTKQQANSNVRAKSQQGNSTIKKK